MTGFAHDFNNILQTISLTASAAASLEDELARAGALALLIEECDRASRLIRSLEDYVAVSPRPPAALDVIAVVGRLEAALEALAGSRVELSLEMSPRPCFVLATRAEIERVVMNLVANACDASPAGGCVRVSVTRVLDDVKIRVVDEGLGVSPPSGSRVSDALSTTRAGRESTGVGLAVVSDLVRALGGSARLEAAGDGGTCFEVTLPAAPAEP